MKIFVLFPFPQFEVRRPHSFVRLATFTRQQRVTNRFRMFDFRLQVSPLVSYPYKCTRYNDFLEVCSCAAKLFVTYSLMPSSVKVFVVPYWGVTVSPNKSECSFLRSLYFLKIVSFESVSAQKSNFSSKEVFLSFWCGKFIRTPTIKVTLCSVALCKTLAVGISFFLHHGVSVE